MTQPQKTFKLFIKVVVVTKKLNTKAVNLCTQILFQLILLLYMFLFIIKVYFCHMCWLQFWVWHNFTRLESLAWFQQGF